MSTETAEDHGFARRRTDRATAEPAVADPAEATDDVAPSAASAPSAATPPTASSVAPSAASAPGDYDDDDALDTDGESDASEADEADPPEPSPALVEPGLTDPERVAGAVRDDGRPHRRRRDDDERDLAPAPRRGRAGWIAAVVVLVLLLAGAATLDWYLWRTSNEWEARSEALTAINYDLGGRLSAEQQTTMQLSNEIDLLTQQLATSNQKVTDLSAEKASAVDESAYYLQEIDALEQNVESAAGTASALQRCVDGQQELVTYLQDAELYDPEDLEAFRTSVDELCTQAEEANVRLQDSLTP